MSCTKLFVANLSSRVSLKDLEHEFSAYGRVRDIVIKGSNYAFVEYENPHDAENAIDKVNGLELYGKKLRCEFAHGGGGDRRRRMEHHRNPRNETCFICGSSRHFAKECPEGEGFGVTDGKCFRCGRTGHIAKHCTRKRSRSPPRGRRSFSRSRSSSYDQRRRNSRSPRRMYGRRRSPRRSPRRRSRSPRYSPHRYEDRKSRSPPRYNSRSPRRQSRSNSYNGRRTNRSPDYNRSISKEREVRRSISSHRKRSISLNRRSLTPKRRSGSPVGRRSRSPLKNSRSPRHRGRDHSYGSRSASPMKD